MQKIKFLGDIEGTDLIRVEIDHIVCIKPKSFLKKEKINNELIIGEAFAVWSLNNGFLGVRRGKLEGYFDCSKSRKKKLIARIRREKEIVLSKRNYFRSKK